ncbi:MarR family transcriptional regulator [Peteryoungia desertarenae]|uniref:MarR family transcriptional regulator n=2 Tax=Peteryoungia desertarenae TaxID=1813451 RepID=A0ABX6QRI0_9HYPH|nr:MarR family transcriptional regulator [Peteryoungia desertarenae]
MEDSLRRLQWHMWFRWREESRSSGSMDLTAAELDYLYLIIAAETPLRLADLAKQMRVSPASASVMVRKLQRAGYLDKLPDSTDGRSILIAPTARCGALEAEEQSIYAETATRMASALTADELLDLDRLLQKACSSLEPPKT